jgi:predicted TIM-barrel fold metal-dependent hydrolase
MVLGTAGDRLLDHAELTTFYEVVAEENLVLAVHVGWACPALNNLYTHIYPSGVIAFLIPLLMGFVALISGGVLDRLPNLRVVFLEAGCQWIHFTLDRLDHRFQHARTRLSSIVSETAPRHALAPAEYIRRGNLYFSTEVEDTLLPQALQLVGDGQIVFGSDMPHGDRERFAARALQQRSDLTDSAKEKILQQNPRRLYAI